MENHTASEDSMRKLTRGALRARLAIIFVARTVLTTSQRIVYPFLPSLARGLGVSLTTATRLITLRQVAGLVAPFLGPWADHRSRRDTMGLALVAFSAASALLASVGNVTATALAFALYGIAKVLYDPAMHAYVGDTVPYEERGRAMGIVELSWSGAWLLGVPFSGILTEHWGWHAPWAVLTVLGLASAGLIYSGLRPTSNQADTHREYRLIPALLPTWRTLLRTKGVPVLLLTGLLLVLAQEIPFIVYGAWLESTFGLSLSTLGLASIVVGCAEAGSEGLASLITDRLGKRNSVLISLLGLAASLLILPWLSTLGLIGALAGVALMILTFEFGLVSLLPLATELVPTRRASLLSFAVTAFSLGHILGTLIGGWLWQWENIALHAGVGTVCAVGAAILLMNGMPKEVDIGRS